jgi:hypothetical protein
MPIEPCTNKDGKHGFRWGGPTAPCQVGKTPEESKKQAIRVGLKVAGPKNFTRIMKKEHGKGLVSAEDMSIANEIVREATAGWYERFGNGVKEYFATSTTLDTSVDQYGKKKKPKVNLELPNDHYETSYTTQAEPVETMDDKQQHMDDLSDKDKKNSVQTTDTNSEQVFNLREKQRRDEEDKINIENPTT